MLTNDNALAQVGREGISFVKESVVPVKIPITECPDPLLSLPAQVCLSSLLASHAAILSRRFFEAKFLARLRFYLKRYRQTWL